jgi:hypothetical protein
VNASPVQIKLIPSHRKIRPPESILRFKLSTLKKTMKLMQTLEEMQCKGVEFNALKIMFCKYTLGHLRLHTFCEME